MKHAALLLFVLLPLPALAAPVPKETEAEKIKRLFGKLVDPDGDCEVSLDGNRLRLRVSDRPQGLAPNRGMLNTPRLVREVAGDFTAVAKVRILRPTSPDQLPSRYLAGLVILAGDTTVLHHSRQFDTTRAPHRLGGQYAFFQDGRQKRSGGSSGGGFSAETATLRIERTGEKVLLTVAGDNGRWLKLPEIVAPLPDRVTVGVYAGHEGNSAFTAEFEDFAVTRGPGGVGKH